MADHDNREHRDSTPPHADTGGPSAEGSHLGDPSLQILQQINSFIQSAMAQNRIDVEQLINEKLASHVNNNQTHGGSEGHTGDHIPHTRTDRVSFKTFKGCGATEFSGAMDPIIACSWLTNTEKIFEISHCGETDKVIYATALLTNQALDWWNALADAIGGEQRRAMTWTAFKQKFMLQYCPPDLQRKYEKEFFDLKQGNLSVTAYEVEFLKKSKFAKVFLSSEEVRVRRFIDGLRWEIKEFVPVRDVPSMEKAAEYARERETALAARNSESMPLPKRAHVDQAVGSSSSSSFRSATPGRSFQRSFNQSRFSSPSTGGPRLCNRCGRRHFGACNINPGRSTVSSGFHPISPSSLVCHRCNKVGHIAPYCPQKVFSPGCFECGATIISAATVHVLLL